MPPVTTGDPSPSGLPWEDRGARGGSVERLIHSSRPVKALVAVLVSVVVVILVASAVRDAPGGGIGAATAVTVYVALVRAGERGRT